MSRPPKFKFRLYIAGITPNSAQALTNLTAICNNYLPDSHEVEIVDVFTEPARALKDKIVMTPMLVKCSPLPEVRIVGTLSQELIVVNTLDLAGFQA